MVNKKVFCTSKFMFLVNDFSTFFHFQSAENEQSFTQSTKILVAFWCLATFVLVQSYTSCLISYLTTPKFIPIANTIGDIADNGELSLVVWKFTSMEPVILVNTCWFIQRLTIIKIVFFYFRVRQMDHWLN